jgi:DNA polymerase-3 subunit gamma/tau
LGITDKATIFKFLNYISQKKAKEAVGFLNELIFNGVDLKEFTKSLIQYLREILFLKIDSDFQNPLFLGLDDSEKKELKNLAESFSEPELQEILEKFMEAEEKMKYSSIPQLPLELAIVEICHKNQ